MKKLTTRLTIAATVASLIAALGVAQAQSDAGSAPARAPMGSGTDEGSLADRMERGSGTGIPAYQDYDPSTHNRVAMSEAEYRAAVAAATPAPVNTASAEVVVPTTPVPGTTVANNAPMGSGTEQGSAADRMERITASPSADTTSRATDTTTADSSSRGTTTAAWEPNRDTRRARADRN